KQDQRVKCCQDLLKLVSSVSPGRVLVLLGFGGAEASLGGAHGARFSTPRVKHTARKTMILMGFTCKPRRISITTLPAETTADRNTMIEYLKTTGKRFLRLKKDKIRLKDCLLMWDNARPHTATDTRKFLTRRDVEP
ncbi:Uncharacterized protein FKW44_015138, partial [Caligus rogercresseyi]